MLKNVKAITLMLVVVMLMSLTAACANDNNEGSATSTATGSASTDSDGNTSVNEATKDPYEITMAMPFFGPIPTDLTLVEAEISRITKEKINATIKILPISIGAYLQQMNLMSSGGEKLDLFVEFGSAYHPDAAAGKLVELNELLDNYGKDIISQFEPEHLNSAKINGKFYGLPSLKEFSTGVPGVMMRKDLVEKYNIDVTSIHSLDDLDKVYETIKSNEPNIVPLGIGMSVPSDQYVWYDSLGDKLGVLPDFDNDLKVVNLYETPEYENYLKKMHSWFEAGFINKDASTSQIVGVEMMRSGKIFSYFAATIPGSTEAESRNSATELVFAPVGEKGYSITAEVLISMWGISSNSNNPERTMMFLNLLYSDPELANLLLWGIEGKHYVKSDDGTVDFPEGLSSSTVGYRYESWVVPNVMITYPYKTEGADIWTRIKEMNSTISKSAALGFAFNSESVRNELTAINNVSDQYRKILETGTVAPDKKLEEFRTKLKAAGIEKVIAEKQKQLDEWAAAGK